MMRVIITLLLTVGFVLSSCGEPKMDRVQRLVADKVKIERARLEAICRNELITKAIEQVDSIIIERALRDTSAIFIRPVRPDVPNLNIPDIDTLGIKPLFGNEEE